eukprot:Polyplicarium_translucidae@DN1444_c0_g1_i1.p1
MRSSSRRKHSPRYSRPGSASNKGTSASSSWESTKPQTGKRADHKKPAWNVRAKSDEARGTGVACSEEVYAELEGSARRRGVHLNRATVEHLLSLKTAGEVVDFLHVMCPTVPRPSLTAVADECFQLAGRRTRTKTADAKEASVGAPPLPTSGKREAAGGRKRGAPRGRGDGRR